MTPDGSSSIRLSVGVKRKTINNKVFNNHFKFQLFALLNTGEKCVKCVPNKWKNVSKHHSILKMMLKFVRNITVDALIIHSNFFMMLLGYCPFV